MIFKTINSSVDETRKTLALFNKDWNTYKRNWQNANGVFGKIGSVFTPANAITKNDIEAIKAYNSQIDSCVTSQTAFNRTMLNASPAAQNLVASYNGGKVSAQGMATAQNAAKASTIGLTIAQTTLNAAIGMGIGLLISLVVKGIDKLVHANEEAIEKAEELRRKYEEFKSTNESNVATLNGLKKEFEDLSKGVSQYGDNVSLTTEQYERYKEIIQQIVGMSPSLAEGYSTENGYIADKNGLLERAIELQEQEYRNELRKITNLDNLKTSMSGYIAEYKEAFNGGLVTDDMSAISTTTATDLSNALYQAFNLNGSGKHTYDNTEKIARKIIESLGIKDVNSEIQKYINKNGIYESSWFFKAYADTIAENIEVITDSLTADIVGLDDTVFDQNIEKVDSAAQSYLDMKDAISMANESIQRDLGYIAEYADGYSNLSTEQQKFVNEFLKDYDISDIMSESNNPFDQGWKFDEDKMASVKRQIADFVEALSQDETTKSALADLYAIPTDEQSISKFIEQFKNALEVIKAYCQENGIEIPIAITDSEKTINDLEAQYQRAIDFAKNKFNGYDSTKFFNEHSINTQEEIDTWQEIAQRVNDATEAEKEYLNALGSGKDTEKITTISGILEKFGHTEAIDKYKDKVSSLQSYLEKLESGSFSPVDSEALANEFNIVGDTVEERIDKINAKIQSEKYNIIAIIDEIIAKGLADGSLGEAELEKLRSYKNILKDIADINLDKNINFDLSDNTLADIQKLSQGLDQLDKIYADILDKEEFDFSSILNNDQFKEAFSAYTEEYDNFINTVSKSPDDINACQEAFNKLTAAYIKGSGVLSEVTEATKAGTIAMLKQMGVANAASIVEQAFIENEKMLAAQKYATAQGCDDLRKATYEEINALIAEGETTEEVLKYLSKLALEKWELNKTKLETQADCDNLLKLAEYAGATTEQIKDLKNAMDDLNTFDYTNPIGSMTGSAFDWFFERAAEKIPGFKNTGMYENIKKNKKKDTKARKTIEDILEEIGDNLRKQLDIPEFKVDYTGGTATKDTRERLAKEKEKEEKKKEETAENIDFIEIKLNNLIDTASKAKDKISDLLSFGAKKKQTQKAIEATTKALEAEYKAMKQYAKFAESFSADAAKETIETVTEDVSSAVSDAVNGAVTNIVSTTAGVVNDAMQYVGKLPYVWGGTSLANGADCSGFTQQLYKAYGINLDRTAQAQYDQNIGLKVTKDQLQPGDMVFFNGYKGAGGVGHVGIYIGGGQFVHEPGSGQTAKVSYLSDRKDFVGGKRFGNINNTPSSSAPSTGSYDSSTTTTTYTKVVPGIDSKTLAHYQKLIREGSFDIETITNEKLKNAIKSYQEWYDKMKSCRDKIDELNNDLKELYKTMAQIPIEKRDKNVDTLDTRLDILNSKRENISAVIVDPEKYASTQKTLKTSKTSVKKGLKTKAQRNATGLSKTEIDTIKKQMKKGQTIPAKILGKITNGAFYEQCKQYNDAVYEHSQYAKTMRTAGDSIKKFHTISDQILDAEKSKTKQYKTAYNDISKSYGKSLDHVKTKGSKTGKAFGSKKSGLTDADLKRIKSCINAGKQIPTDLMAQLESQSIYDSCVEYNKAVMENEAFREQLDTARFDLQKQQQAETAARLQNKTEKHQNIADKASAKMERNEALAENADTPKKKNKYLSKNLDLLQTEYKHLIKIAELENDSVKAAKLRAELEKETADIIEQQFQNISDYYSARRDKISDKESLQDARYENAQVDVKKKNDILNIKTRFASERNAESEQEYTDTAKLFNANRTDAKKAVNKVKKLSSSDKEKILKLMESKEEIPENLMDKVAELDPDAYQKLLNYNDSLDWLEKAALNKKISNEELIKTKRENEIQKHQNIADRAQDKMDKNDALREISTTASEQNQYEKENIKYLNTQYKHLLEIAKLHEDDVEYARLEAEQQAKIADAYKAMFDHVQTEFENKISLISNDISDLDHEIRKVEASGRLVDASYYNHKISFENESLAKLKEEETSLVEQLKNIKMFSPAWYECQDAIQSVQNAQADSLEKVKGYKDAINEIADTIQNDIVDAFHAVTDEAELLITLLGDDLSDEDTGALTKDGLAVLSLYVTQMNICKDAAESFHKEINSMQDALDSGNLSFIDANGIQREYASVFELKKAIKDFYASYRDEIKHAYDYESKIVDMMIKKYQSELDYLKELIEKKKAELNAEKDLHGYAKSLKEQTDNINSLRKQIAALKGDTSKETESRIQKLQSQLKEAESSLEDQEYERYISDQQDMLDHLYDEYAKLVNDVMKDHDKLLREGLDLFAQTASDVQDVIKITAEEHGYEITAEMEKIVASIEDMGSLDSYLGVGGTVTQSLSDIVNEVHNAYVGIASEFQGLKDAIASIGYQGKYDTSDLNHTDDSMGSITENTGTAGSNTGSTNTSGNHVSDTDLSKLPDMDSVGLATKSFIEKLLRSGTNTYDPKTTSSLNKYIYGKYGSALTVDEMAKLSGYLGFNYTSKQLAAENPNHSERKMKMLKKLQAYGFSNGGIVPDDALKLKELGMGRASNGDTVIGTLKPKESVFNEKQTKMIQEYVKKAPDYKTMMDIGNYMDKMIKLPEAQPRPQETSVKVEYDNVNINLPNVMNYEDFMCKMQKDHDFEKMINYMVSSQMGLGNRYNKYFVNFRN